MYTPLYIKTDNSLLSSMIKIDDLINYAIQNNLKSLTITDNNMYGVLDFYKACIKNDIKPIIGLELSLEERIVLYAKNNNGYHNLVKLATINSESKIDLNILTTYADDLICIIPTYNSKLYSNLSKIYKDIFLGYHNIEEKNNIKIPNSIYINEILYLNKSDSKYLKYLLAIKNGNLEELNYNNNLILEEEVKQKYSIDNNDYIYNNCNVTIDYAKDLMPVYDPKIDSYSLLKKQCIIGLKRVFGANAPKLYVERLKHELNIIKDMGFCDYFLVVADFIKYAKDNNILIGPGRGSAVGSLVAYLLNIIAIDPVKYDLLFERFLNPERVTMPDIDIDIEDDKRDELIRYCINKYGAKKVVPIIAFGTLGSKQAIRDVGRAMNIDIKVTNHICSMLSSHLSLFDNYKQNKKLSEYLEMDDELKELYKVALKFEGLKRHTTIHAAGVIISNKNIDDIIPLDKSHDDFYTTAYSMDHLESIGLLKMDFLAIRNLTIINNIIKEIGNGLTFDNIPLDDPKTNELFMKADTLGIFQFESSGMINFLKKLKPHNFEDIYTALALFRPGPMQNIDSFIKRRNGLEKIDYFDSSLIPILRSTNGIIIYQEQIMQIANLMASYSLGEADILRRAMSKKKEDILINEKEKYITRSIKNGYSPELSEKIFNLILKFAEYGFNKSHSVGYGVVSYKMAYLKANYKEIFMKHLLSNFIDSATKIKQYIYECKLNNIGITLPNINISTNDFIIKDNKIVYPLTGIKNISNTIASYIVEERKNGIYKDIFDFIDRCNKIINKQVMESLIDASAFDIFKINKRTIHENMDILLNYSEISSYMNSINTIKPELISYDEYDSNTLMNKELEMYGFYLTNHPVTNIKIKYKNIISLNDLNSYLNKVITTVICVDKLKEITTKKNEKMLFITGSDELNIAEFVCFPKIYKDIPSLVTGDIVLIKGTVEKRFDQIQVIVDKIKKD